MVKSFLYTVSKEVPNALFLKTVYEQKELLRETKYPGCGLKPLCCVRKWNVLWEGELRLRSPPREWERQCCSQLLPDLGLILAVDLQELPACRLGFGLLGFSLVFFGVFFFFKSFPLDLCRNDLIAICNSSVPFRGHLQPACPAVQSKWAALPRLGASPSYTRAERVKTFQSRLLTPSLAISEPSWILSLVTIFRPYITRGSYYPVAKNTYVNTWQSFSVYMNVTKLLAFLPWILFPYMDCKGGKKVA